MKKRLSILTLLLTLLIILTGCDNGSVSDSAVSKSSSLVKVCLTVDGDSSDLQKSVGVSGDYWTSLTYQYNAVPQWIAPDSSKIHGVADWTPINYSAGMSLGYYSPGPWVFGIRIKNGSTVVYEGFSAVTNVEDSSVNVEVLVSKLVTDAVKGSVRISVTAPTVVGDSLTVKWWASPKGAEPIGSATATPSRLNGLTTFEYTVPDMEGTHIFTLSHSSGKSSELEVVLPEGQMAVISGHMDNGIWQLGYNTAEVYSIGATCTGSGAVMRNVTSAAVGDRVSFYVKPASGSELRTLAVSWSGGSITPTSNVNLYSFIMPAGDVSISATFDSIDTNININNFKTILMALYDVSDVKAFGRSETPPSNVEYVGLNDILMWYDEDDQQIYWFGDNATNKIKFSTTSMAELFKDLVKFESISLKGFDTSNITNMHGLFENCANLKAVDLDGVVTGSVTDMANMFYKAGTNYVHRKNNPENGNNMVDNDYDLEIRNLRFDTHSVTTMARMFQLSNIKNLCTPTDPLDENTKPTNISEWVTSSVTNMSYMFAGEYGKNPTTYTYNKVASLDLSSWNTSSVTDFSYMFDYCNRLTTMNISNFNFASATTITRLFDRCESLTSLTFPSHTVLDNVTDMCWALSSIDKLTVDDWEAILACWDIDRCPIAFIDYAGTPTETSENPNRIYKGNGTILTTTTNARREFSTYGNATVYFGGKGTGVNSNDAQRLVKITP